MKTTFTLVLAAFGIVGLSFASQVVAQETSRYVPNPMMQQTPNQPSNAALPAGNGQPEEIAAGPQVSGMATAPAGVATSNTATMPGSVIDNNLWPGAAQIPGCAICGGGNCTPADWYIDQDVRIIARSRPRDAVIGYDYTSAGTLTEVLNTRAATPGISGAWGMTIGHYFARDTDNRDNFLEFSFWGMNNWTDEAAVYGHTLSDGNTVTGITTKFGSLNSQYINVSNGEVLEGFNNADKYTVYYSSTTNNFELNGRIVPRGRPDREVFLPNGQVRRECQPGAYISYLYGLRFFQLNETFRFHSESLIQTYDSLGDLLTSNEYTGDYDTVTHNNLLGLQAGVDLTFRECRWAWGLRAKIGPYVNFADQESDIHADEVGGGDYLRRVCDSRHSAAFIGEAGVEASYKFRPTLVGRISYDAMWVTGVAIAPEQMQFAVEPVNKINTNGLAFFQGLTLGLEWQW